MANDFKADIAAIQRIDAVPRILDVVCRATGMGFAAVARVTEDRWIACAVRDSIKFGLVPGGELKVETTICDEIRQNRAAVVIDHVADDAAYCGHPTPKMYGFQSYISMPINLANGTFFGTLCAIDPRPARLKNNQTIEMFKLFAELIAVHLDVTERLASSEASLLNELQARELREQFIAVLGHDLRNPLASIDAGATLLLKTPLDQKALGIVTLMQKSVVRMSVLINNVLDFARGRLGGGLALNRTLDAPLEPALSQVVAELRSSHPERVIDVQFRLGAPVICDPHRIAELFSNLLGNALTYGAPAEPIRVLAATDEHHFELSVANGGEPIPAGALERLFQPFTRGADRPNQQGLGLGLYIASEIAKAHGGTFDVTSTPAETRFTLRMPLC
jgi:signal transduction histidine kinase